MTKKLDTLLGKYQGNAYPAMLQHLGEHLGVSESSLRRLGLGWAPIVTFKKGDNFSGWWVIPERSTSGEVLGLSLRSQRDMKVMYPGSKHGLVFEINPNHVEGEHGFSPGAHNWVRLIDAKVQCPVCGKPDGCVVSQENPEDPKAAICIRVSEGSVKPMRLGFLHILKEAGQINRNAHILPPSEYPVLVVEGMTDTAAAMDLGFVAVGRPSNLACMGELANLLRGRDCIILGENDRKSDGKEPGKEGMIAARQALKLVCPSAKMLLPPEQYKDLRQWVKDGHATMEDILRLASEADLSGDELRVVPNSKPLTVARAFLDHTYRMAGRTTLRQYGGCWFLYEGSRYRELSPDEIRGAIYGWAQDRFIMTDTPNGESMMKAIVANRHFVGDMLDAMLHDCPVREQDAPCWINGTSGPDPRDLIAFDNGILWVSKYLEGADESEYLLESTPDFFNMFALPFAFNPTESCPAWQAYLDSSLGDDPAKVDLLNEWFGYCLTPDTRMHKMMMLRGPRRSGKSTTLDVLHNIVGRDQCVSTNFAQLASDFALQPLVGKLCAIMGDARLPTKTDNMRALEVLLNIVGEDPQQINRKYLPSLASHKLTTRFTISTNELPELPDHSGALEARLLILDFKTSFVGREDWDLKAKLREETAGIVVWALDGLRRLREQGRFTMPESAKESLREWRTTTSPMAGFLEECCDEVPEEEVTKEELYEAWTKWSGERGMRPLPKGRFYERVKANAPNVLSTTYERGGHKFSVYKHMRLKRWAAKQYLGRIS
jgi:putative DNA primase/helicase